MKTIILTLLLTPVLGFSQKSFIFIKLTDARGQQIKGESATKGYENWLQSSTTNSSGKNNTTFSFMMSISGASADLKRAMTNGEFLVDGQVVFTAMDPMASSRLLTSYTIKMEKISVLNFDESLGCNGVMNTAVTLQATRIGWTYYQTGKTGTQVVSKKYGWDAESNGEWVNF
jgi:type VI protein secretion system component Hcp